jgi:3-phytase
VKPVGWLGAAALVAACAQPGPGLGQEGQAKPKPPGALLAARLTEPVPNDPDDPAVWIHPTDPAKSLVFGTDKHEGTGGLYAFDLDGKIVQAVTPLDRPNNVDVQQGCQFGSETWDIAVVTERVAKRLRIYRIGPEGRLSEVSAADTKVFKGEEGDAALPMGVSIYRRPRDGAVFAVVGRKSGPKSGYLHQYRLSETGGRIGLELVRSFGAYSGENEIEAILVDDETGLVWFSDERKGVRIERADPDAADAGQELAMVGTEGFEGDHEGIAFYPTGPGAGYVVVSDQVKGGSRLQVFDRAAPHRRLAVIPTDADDTDGLEVVTGLGPDFPIGALVMMSSADKRFRIYDWRDVAARLP